MTVSYEQQMLQWRAHAEATLRADDGWLTLAGLFWLEEGVNRIGSDPSNTIVLPDSVPAFVGSLTLQQGRVVLEALSEVDVMVNTKAVRSTTLRSDATGAPDLMRIGTVTLFVIARGARIGVRVRDSNSLVRQAFEGRQWFPVREAYLVTATFEPYDPPKTLAITNILGDTEDMPCPGTVVFALQGATYRLDATSGQGGGLFLIFRDATSGHTTYGAGRFLYTSPPADGKVVLDFNRAVSPPCAFTAYATCPLPPPQNVLPLRIEAGERYEHTET